MDSKKPQLPLPAQTPHSRPRSYTRWVFVFLALFWLSRLSCFDNHRHNVPVLVVAQHGAVAAENERCSTMGVNVLKNGGNAVDSAISATLCMGVVNSFASGIGGGGFMTIRIPPKNQSLSSEVFTIDFRETAPALANKTMFTKGTNSSRWGGLAIAVPGELRGLQEAHRRWGSMPWKDLVNPSAKLAAGWEVDAELGKRLPWAAPLLLYHPDWAPIFAPNGRLLREGEIIRFTNYSKTLAEIATHGADAFYSGPIADSLVRKIQASGGIITHQDLANYTVKVNRALQGTFHDKKVYTTHAPTSGAVLLHMLNLIEKFNMTERNGLNTHRLVEILKFGFAARTKIGDPAFMDNTRQIEEISTKAFADEIFKNITDDRTHPPDYYNPQFDVEPDYGTSHLSVVDKDGMAVSITSTINYFFGSFVLDPETGVILNNEMDDFSIPGIPNGFGLWPSPHNYPEPGKRSLSSTAPTIMEHADGSFYLAIGGSGGSRIFGSILQTIVNLAWGLNPSDAVEYGRLHNQLYPLFTDIENTYPKHLVDALRDRGHNITVLDGILAASEVQVVTQTDGKIYAASDSRKNGIAAGY